MRHLACLTMVLAIAIAGLAIRMQPPLLPSFAEVRAQWRPSDAQLLDRQGNIIYEMRIEPRGRRFEWTPLAEVSPALEHAVIQSEDRRFFVHQGVDIGAIAAAILARLIGRGSRGASTIAMQLVPMLAPQLGRGGHRSMLQKLIQMRAAYELERHWSRRQILEAYLNLVTWRGEIQGVDAASWLLFDKAPQGLSACEALVMAALLRGPNARYEVVVRRVSALRRSLPTDEPLWLEVSGAIGRVFASRRAALRRVEFAPHAAARLLGSGAMSARSTLDLDVQRFATESLKRHVSEVHDRSVDDGAVLVIENATGQVWAYVGSTGEISPAAWVDGVRSLRQPGSALKPFLYAAAIDRRLLTAASLLEDTPLEVPEERGIYRPLDYDGKFRGLVSTRTALASSINVPAVRTIKLLGVETFAAVLHDLDLSSVVEGGDFYGAALALGSADVSLWDLAAAYLTLANGGIWSPLRLSPDSIDLAQSRRVFSAAATFVISDILADRASRSATFGLENSLATRYWSAVKTGTSKDMRDNWCIGYTNKFTVAVWVGNVSGAPMRDVSGITGAAPVWLDVMNYLHDRYGSGPLTPPAAVSSRPVSFPNEVETPRYEWFLEGTEPAESRAQLDVDSPRIVSPIEASTIALDPDIPPRQQLVMFSAEHAVRTSRWWLDGHQQCIAAGPCMWAPEPGHHRLALVSGSGNRIDRVSFTVRGRLPDH